MISPQEPGTEYYYPTHGTTRISTTHPSVAYTYWRNRIGKEIALEIEQACDHAITKPCPVCISAAFIASGAL